jgi:RNA polymerase sigma-70 factor (ECF subfamily)
MSSSSTDCRHASANRRPRHARRFDGGQQATRARIIPRIARPILPKDGFLRPSDEELLVRYRDSGRAEDFTELVHRYSGELGRYLARYLGDRAMAEDVVQDTFLQVHSKCGLFRNGWQAKPWLYALAIHRAVDTLRRTRRLRLIQSNHPLTDLRADEAGSLLELLASPKPGPLEELQERDRQQWVRDSVSRLPEALRQVLVLAYDQDLSYSEIAGLLEIPLGTVKSRLHTAISRMRTMAERYDKSGSL